MAGFKNQTLYANNVDFTGSTSPVPTVTADGQLLIGSTVFPNIRVGTLTAGSGISITNAAGSITIAATGGGGGITTINGDSGSITGSTVTIFANNVSNNCGSTVKFSNTGTISTLNVTDSSSNTILGKSAGNATLSGNINSIFGANAGSSLTTGFNNNFFGYFAGNAVNSGTSNNIFGNAAGQFVTTGSDNVLLGQATGGNLVGGSRNILVGTGSGFSLVSGTDNLSIGYTSGSAYTTSESSNILLTNTGVVGDSNVIRIGTQGSGTGQQNTCFIAGITGVTTSNSNFVTIDTTTGQLGAVSGGGGGGITTLDGDTGSATGATVLITALGSISTRTCGSSVSFTGSGATIELDVTDASSNTIIGNGAGNGTLSGSFNSVFGTFAGGSLMSGPSNTIIGGLSGASLTTGSTNTIIGMNTAGSLVSGGFNICIGNLSGSMLSSSESSNILISNLGVTGESNAIHIGTEGSSSEQQNKCFIAGIFGATTSDVGSTTAVLIDNTGNLGTAASSLRYKENIKDLGDKSSGIYKLRPVSFNYKKDEKKTPQSGLIAEEVLSIMPELVVMKHGIPETVKYHDLPVLLLNEIQNLKKEIEELKTKIK